MSKIKVIQVIDSDDLLYLLDDKGRVWYDGGHSELYTEKDFTTKSKWIQEWKQINLPEEPEESK